jgi:hypothetical protein
MLLHISMTTYALHPQTCRSRIPFSWIYELEDIISLCGRNIFAELHIDCIILGSRKISYIEINYLYHRVFVIYKNRMRSL